MYGKSAAVYDQIYSGKDYLGAATSLHTLVQSHCPNAKTLLDVACGTGRHLEFLRRHYQVSGLDLNQSLLDKASDRLPRVPLYRANMKNFKLDTRFDVVVCLFSAIAYASSKNAMRSTIRSMRRHLTPGGMIVVEPWFSPDNYWTNTITANHVDTDELKISWMYTSDVKGDTSVLKMRFMVGTPQGVKTFSETHVLGLFSYQEYRQAFLDAGMTHEYDSVGFFGRGLHFGTLA